MAPPCCISVLFLLNLLDILFLALGQPRPFGNGLGAAQTFCFQQVNGALADLVTTCVHESAFQSANHVAQGVLDSVSSSHAGSSWTYVKPAKPLSVAASWVVSILPRPSERVWPQIRVEHVVCFKQLIQVGFEPCSKKSFAHTIQLPKDERKS